MDFFQKLFKKDKVPEFDIEKAVGEYLLKLPRCNKDVLIVSSEYKEIHYRCEISVAAEDLLPWAEDHADGVVSCDQEEQAARKGLPIWLRGSDSKADGVSSVPHFMYEVLRPYVLDFIHEATTKIYCNQCQSFVDDINMKKINEKRLVDWSWWTDVWICPDGHQIYY